MDRALAPLIVLAGLILAAVLYSVWRRRAARRMAATRSSTATDTTRSQEPQPQARQPIPPQPIPPPATADPDDRIVDDVAQPPGEASAGATDAEIERDQRRELTDSTTTTAAPQPARFSAYYPKEIAPNVWLPLRAYVYRLNATDTVAKDAADALNGALSEYRPVSGDASAPLAEGTLITATPDLPGFQFNPLNASVAFFEDWHALPFRLRATTAPLEQAANGRITITADGVIVADLPLSIFVTAQSASSAATAPAVADADPYDSIFCSYSHRDSMIVERVERAYRALGLDFLRDVTTLRSGEEWNARLLELIEESDIFQLFWSGAAAESKYVRQEWKYALTLKRGGFIRPVYWEQPMPKAPAELSALHFHFDPTLDD